MSVERVGAFFGAGSALLVASLCGSAWWLRRRSRSGIEGHGWLSVSKLGMRTATYRPGRSVLSIAVIASATFILVSVEAFRRGDRLADTGPRSGVGGYDLIVETLLPVVRDPNTREGREALNLFGLDQSVTFEPLRLLPGDDASCLNLYEPRNPRIVAAGESFLRQRRFAFQSSLAATDAERANPWLLLERVEPDGAIPVIADANSMTYVLHKKLGDDIVLPRGDRQIRLRLVAALSDSIFQGELLMAEQPFSRLFPEQEGYQVLLVSAGHEPPGKLRAALEEGMSDLGARVSGTAERLAQFHRVENTYLSTFQTLGGLGTSARHIRARDRAPSQRAGAKAGVGAARRRWLSSRARDDDGRGRERAAADRGPGCGSDLCHAGDCAGSGRARQSVAIHGWQRAPAHRGARDRFVILGTRHARSDSYAAARVPSIGVAG